LGIKTLSLAINLIKRLIKSSEKLHYDRFKFKTGALC